MGMLQTCNCDATKALLRDLGVKQPSVDSDEEGHFRAEENNIIPLMRVYGLGAEADRWLREHKALRAAKPGKTRARFLALHAAFEDRCVLELRRRIALEKGAFKK